MTDKNHCPLKRFRLKHVLVYLETVHITDEKRFEYLIYLVFNKVIEVLLVKLKGLIKRMFPAAVMKS